MEDGEEDDSAIAGKSEPVTITTGENDSDAVEHMNTSEHENSEIEREKIGGSVDESTIVGDEIIIDSEESMSVGKFADLQKDELI